ncbi:hydroxyacylglutathione hydrolase [Deinococcus metalli]|uniref:Hydroxyacylglutathione hydrolase n=1 Tax=Deinococcus metalli TaxID=1141878 RepID=A0A7W8KGY5_9DEIO|nr:MBL fold metallo-hydrolase [Deinococcus metalli]MBB5377730.1 hydroxyacylglutathione hydrolase [Deinococcus metalli]GHF52905.1 Zn-dependent hydrolase [Deinococcus metalli]
MYFERFYDPDLAQASYLLGCQRRGEALVIDPVRDVGIYTRAAAAQGLSVTHVTETHIHADYLSGSRQLAAATGAQLLLSAEGGPEWAYAFPHTGLRGGDVFRVGNLRVDVLHTPGHTPESVSFLLTDSARGEQPVMLFTGDFVFVGDVGRPDLLDEAAGGVDTRFAAARQLFASLRDVILTLPDFVQVWPGHGAGSACGKALGAVPSTTVGYERAVGWWAPLVTAGDDAAFTAHLLSGQPDAPLYYARIKAQNRAGPALLGGLSPLPELDTATVRARVAAGARVIDTRPRAEHHAGAPAGSVNLPDGPTVETWAGWLLDPARAYVLLAPAGRAEALRRRLWMVGIDAVVGFTASADGLDPAPATVIPPGELPEDALLLDVRTATEYAAGHLPGARHVHAGRLVGQLGTLPRGRDLLVYCQGGARSAAAASVLRAEGFRVSELDGGYDAWVRAGAAGPPA